MAPNQRIVSICLHLVSVPARSRTLLSETVPLLHFHDVASYFLADLFVYECVSSACPHV